MLELFLYPFVINLITLAHRFYRIMFFVISHQPLVIKKQECRKYGTISPHPIRATRRFHTLFVSFFYRGAYERLGGGRDLDV